MQIASELSKYQLGSQRASWANRYLSSGIMSAQRSFVASCYLLPSVFIRARMRFSPATKNITKLMDIKSLKLLDHFASFNPSPSLHWTISRVWSKCYGV
ncbi:unnamed protein product [Lepeophtheirus salmonis]|uniref:(salmon louse) hypothetical protein n=1 Tax=Lepeophtheirus salmonis TaxID=72036 RepID=A0A7R8H0H0_LEPSM|nr:unnamed protein product [Lepeophtheirus salmonis]CAF2770301.1 unnamed protein product [Lepeophtheirus salmonis]